MASDVDAVIFDLDDTICVHEQDGREIHDAVFDRAGVDPFFEPPDLYALDTDDLPPADSEREYFEHVYRKLAGTVGGDPAHAEPLAAATVEVLDYTQVSFRDGAERALAAARENGPVGLVTNGTERAQTTKLSALGIRDAFDTAVFCGPGTEVPGKPDPTPLERALDELGVSAEHALNVGDSAKLDVRGAHNVGIRSVWVPCDATDRRPDPEPDYVLSGVGELEELL
jgi:HAD superfamily hydrolase (TIGR01509 family)